MFFPFVHVFLPLPWSSAKMSALNQRSRENSKSKGRLSFWEKAHQFPLVVFPMARLPPRALCFRTAELTLKSPNPLSLPEAQRAKLNTLWKATGPWWPGNARRHRAVRSFVMDLLAISCICGRPALWHAKHNWGRNHRVNKAKQTPKAEGKRTRKHEPPSHT